MEFWTECKTFYKYNVMKTYKGTFQLPVNGAVGRFTYIDTVSSYFKWAAKIELKMRNTARLIKVEKI